MNNFLSYYGLSFNPFDKQYMQERDSFQSQDFREMLSRLNYLKDARGIGVFTSGPGMGKSYALRCFAKTLNPNLYSMQYLCLSTVSVAEFYRQLCYVLGVGHKGGKPGMFREIQEQVHYLYKEKRRQRITVHYEFNGLKDDEVSAYIHHKLSKADGAESIISPDALSSLHSMSSCNPRIIDSLMTDALIIGAQQERQGINADIIMAAVNNQQLG